MDKKDIKTFQDFMDYTVAEDPDLQEIYDTNELIIELVQQIVAKREELGLTQRQLAEKSGVPQPSIARLEAVRTNPNLQTLYKLMRPLGLKLKVVEA